MSLSWPPKDPDEVLDYKVDWTDRLNGDTILTSVFTLTTAAGLVIASQTHDTTTSTVWLTGGTNDQAGEVLCRITTAALRTMDQSVKLRIREK